MTLAQEMPQKFADYQVGKEHLGFKICAITPMPNLYAIVYELEHLQSGARILHIFTQDSENLFSISFPTLPLNHTGIPHILEHVVLSGSQRYPVRDPFFEMVKMSMATFINAMTDVDHTMFPVCSNVKQDLFNLADVYFDAVFHPLLSETSFHREGYAYLPKDKKHPLGDLTINGIVYSEMQGAYSAAEAQVLNFVQQKLLSESPYHYDSGGDPEVIPTLTYQQFKNFWEKNYHPSQGYFVFYGNIPTDDYLKFLAPRLGPFTRRIPQPLPPIQPSRTTPRTCQETYTIDPEEASDNKTFLTLHWAIGDVADPILDNDLNVVNHLLLGHEGAPLRRILMESDLGQDLTLSGDMDLGREKIFSVGLKGGHTAQGEAFQKLCLQALNEISDHPFSTEDIQTALNQLAYDVQEIESSYPLDLLEDVLTGWLYQDQATLFLDRSSLLANCRQRWLDNPLYFNQWIRTHLCQNPHRLLLVVSPDPQKQIRSEEHLEHNLQEIRKQLTDEQVLALAKMAEKVAKEASTANSQEQLSTLPQLNLSDLPATINDVSCDQTSVGPITILFPNVFSNGLCYVILNFDLAGLPDHLWQFLPRFTDALEKMGTDQFEYAEIASRLAAVTDGLETSISFSKHADNQDRGCYSLRLAFKCLDHQLKEAITLLQELLFHLNPTPKRRLQTITNQAYSSCRTHLINAGHQTAKLYAKRDFSHVDACSWQVFGLPQLSYLKEVKANFSQFSDSISNAIQEIKEFILNPYRLTISATLGEASRHQLKQLISDWLPAMKAIPKQNSDYPFNSTFTHTRQEALIASIKVAHCLEIFRAPTINSGISPLLTLGSQFLSQEFFLPELRFKGNAYGTSAQYDPLQGTLTFSTFRDPQVANTLQVFSQALDYIQQAQWSREDLKRTIIGTAKNYLFPIRPDNITGLILSRHLQGVSLAIRRHNYQQLLSADPTEIKRIMGDVLEQGLQLSSTCVFTNKQKIELANSQLPHPFSKLTFID